MIKSSRQLSVASRKMQEVCDLLDSALEEGERESLERFCARLRHDVHEYEAISRKLLSSFPVKSVDDLSDALVKARIYRGWTQKQLAEWLGIAEQMVQRDEAGGYEKASLVRLADVADALQFQLVGELRPCERTAAIENGAATGETAFDVVFSAHGAAVFTHVDTDTDATETLVPEATFSVGGRCS